MDNNKVKWNIGRQQEKALAKALEDAKANGETDKVQGLAADFRRKQTAQQKLLMERDD